MRHVQAAIQTCVRFPFIVESGGIEKDMSAHLVNRKICSKTKKQYFNETK